MIKNDDPILLDFWQDRDDPVVEFNAGFAETAIRQYPGLWEYLNDDKGGEHGRKG